MYEGKPMVLVIGGTDTGRTPIAAALLRKALGGGVMVRTAGVLSHEGEGAVPEAQMALDQLGIDISRHLSRPLRYEEHRDAEMLLAVDRGTELVLFSEFPNDPRVACLPALANLPDVLDPHRMPLGIWISAVRQLHDQVTAALPEIRTRLKIQDQQPLPPVERRVERRKSGGSQGPLVLGTGHRTEWDRDEEMQRLMSLINTDAPQNEVTETEREADASEASDEPIGDAAQGALEVWDDTPEAAQAAAPAPPAAPPAGTRTEHVARIGKVLLAAEELPEIVDWARLRGDVLLRLRAIAGQSSGALDFVPAATLMIEGKLQQCRALPDADALFLLRRSVQRLAEPVGASELAQIGGELAQW
jgi:protein-tyrosine-phosphatase